IRFLSGAARPIEKRAAARKDVPRLDRSSRTWPLHNFRRRGGRIEVASGCGQMREKTIHGNRKGQEEGRETADTRAKQTDASLRRITYRIMQDCRLRRAAQLRGVRESRQLRDPQSPQARCEAETQ